MKDFLSTILPNQGIYFITSIKNGNCRNHSCCSFDEMVQKANELDARSYDVFFACASFKQEVHIVMEIAEVSRIY